MPSTITTPLWATTDSPPTKADKAIYGGKGAGLIEMSLAQLPVPEAIILTTETWRQYRANGKLPVDVEEAVANFANQLAWYCANGAMFSVRSGAPVSMPGMMDTVLNVGVTDDLDCVYPGAYRTFAESWLKVVKGTPSGVVHSLLEAVKHRADGDSIRERDLLKAVIQNSGKAVSLHPLEQILACIRAVFDSWDTPRAQAYRAMHNIPEDMGTACVVQRMVMGNAEGFSGSGVMFTRDPATGENVMTGEFLYKGQGEAVVSGAVTPTNLSRLGHGTSQMKSAHSDLLVLCHTLEKAYGDVQDIEFTFENGNLYVLQTRTAKMSAQARIRTALDLAAEMPAHLRTAFLKTRVTADLIRAARVTKVSHNKGAICFTGLAASPGAIVGTVVTRKTPLSAINKGCILVCEDTAPEDFPRMAAAGAIVTCTGGFTCHSAVVARGIGVPAVVGCDVLEAGKNSFTFGEAGHVIAPGDVITVDGAAGVVWLGEQPITAVDYTESVAALFADQIGDRWPVEFVANNRIALEVFPGDLSSFRKAGERARELLKQGVKVALFERDLDGTPLLPSLSSAQLAGVSAAFEVFEKFSGHNDIPCLTRQQRDEAVTLDKLLTGWA